MKNKYLLSAMVFVSWSIFTTLAGSTTPCTTMGFSVESTLTLPSGFGSARMLRVNKTATTGGLGYTVHGNGNFIKVAAFDLDTMTLAGSTTLQATGSGQYYSQGRYAGDTDGDTLFFFLLNNQVAGGGTCPIVGNLCISLKKASVSGGVINIGTFDDLSDTAANLDDARFTATDTMWLINGNNAGQRRIISFATNSLTRNATGSLLGVNAPGMFSTAQFGGYVYAAFSTTTSPNIFQFSPGNLPPVASGNVASGRVPGAIYALTPSGSGVVAVESNINGLGVATRSYMSGTLVLNATDGYPVNTDGNPQFNSTFYDQVNDKVYSYRLDGGAGLTGDWMRLTSTSPMSVQQRFACGSGLCANPVGLTQVADFSENKARLYVVNWDNPAKISKLKVCATGGP